MLQYVLYVKYFNIYFQEKCHYKHDLTYRGLVSDTYCSCQKNTCQSLLGVDQRESAGYKYNPDPIDTSDILENPLLSELIDCLAINNHEVWSKEHIDGGWKYGSKRDNNKLIHPLILPWNLLKDDDKKWDIESAKNNIKLIEYLGYNVVCEDPSLSNIFINNCINTNSYKYLYYLEVKIISQILQIHHQFNLMM